MKKSLINLFYYLPFFILGDILIKAHQTYYGIILMLIGFKIWDEIEFKKTNVVTKTVIKSMVTKEK